MRKIPASEQPTQLNVRETSSPGQLTFQGRSWRWLAAVGVFVVACLGGLAIATMAVTNAYMALDETDEVSYEVIQRPEPVTVASTRGEAVAQAPLSPIFTPEVQFWAPLIAEWALSWEIDPNLIATVIQIESCGDPLVSSSAGAQGLFQVMPFHFDDGEDMLDIQNNARRGLNYLNEGLDISQGHAGLALAGYNGGHSRIRLGSASWYHETQRYYYWGAGIYEDATAGRSQSARLQEWLAAGGRSLCDRARNTQATLDVEFAR